MWLVNFSSVTPKPEASSVAPDDPSFRPHPAACGSWALNNAYCVLSPVLLGHRLCRDLIGPRRLVAIEDCGGRCQDRAWRSEMTGGSRRLWCVGAWKSRPAPDVEPWCMLVIPPSAWAEHLHHHAQYGSAPCRPLRWVQLLRRCRGYHEDHRPNRSLHGAWFRSGSPDAARRRPLTRKVSAASRSAQPKATVAFSACLALPRTCGLVTHVASCR